MVIQKIIFFLNIFHYITLIQTTSLTDGITTLGPCKAKLDDGSIIDLSEA